MINVIAIAGTNPFSDFLLDHIFGGFLKSLQYHGSCHRLVRLPWFGSSSWNYLDTRGPKKPNFLGSPHNGHDHDHNHNHNDNYHDHYNHLPSPNETTTLAGNPHFQFLAGLDLWTIRCDVSVSLDFCSLPQRSPNHPVLPPEVWCFRSMFGKVQLTSHQVFLDVLGLFLYEYYVNKQMDVGTNVSTNQKCRFHRHENAILNVGEVSLYKNFH